ncbi:hypothetical protein J3492_00265 [Psychrobacter sp. F1192]|uniref:SlyX protein n=1 Tax=Psychrobacter coccoides TaxID=2818440 RepID=A0ABS3NJS0_9GAMM|nr:hypothetical protein [Psychrobacter coccoides]MBO1529647.1 hypothetical protein [Psychrobacter coccoides]
MSGLKTEPAKQNEEPSCSCKDLIALITQVIEQNTILIQQIDISNQNTAELIDQNNDLINELVEQEDDADAGSTFLDMD